MFANDRAIAEAIVGREYAAEWLKTRLPTLASQPGFPKVDPFHEGRAVKLVAKFYDHYLGIIAEPIARPRPVVDHSAWTQRKRSP